MTDWSFIQGSIVMADPSTHVEEWLSSNVPCSTFDSCFISAPEAASPSLVIPPCLPPSTSLQLWQDDVSDLPTSPSISREEQCSDMLAFPECNENLGRSPTWPNNTRIISETRAPAHGLPQEHVRSARSRLPFSWPVRSVFPQTGHMPMSSTKDVDLEDVLSTYPRSSRIARLQSEALMKTTEPTTPMPDIGYEPFAERDMGTHSSFTPASTFSQCSSTQKWPMPNIEDVDDTTSGHDYYRCDFSKPTGEDTANSHRDSCRPVTVSTAISCFHNANSKSNASIHISEPQARQTRAVDSTIPYPIQTEKAESIDSARQPLCDSRSMSPSALCSYFDIGMNAFNESNYHTLAPSNISKQATDISLSEVPSANASRDIKIFDKLHATPDAMTKTTSMTFKEDQAKSLSLGADIINADSPRGNSLQTLYKDQDHPSIQRPSSASRRRKSDQFLVDSKLAGMSYRDIRAMGHFKEAESTLRGRFRTLTKCKEHRVRKPQWQEKDVSLSHPPCGINPLLTLLAQASETRRQGGFGRC